MGEKGLMCWDERKLSNERLDFYHNSTKNERKQKKKRGSDVLMVLLTYESILLLSPSKWVLVHFLSPLPPPDRKQTSQQ